MRIFLFNGPGKSANDLEKAVRNGSFIHIDHFDEYFLLSDVCQKNNLEARVAVRVNMDIGIYPRWDRFGFNYEEWRSMGYYQSNYAESGIKTNGAAYTYWYLYYKC